MWPLGFEGWAANSWKKIKVDGNELATMDDGMLDKCAGSGPSCFYQKFVK